LAKEIRAGAVDFCFAAKFCPSKVRHYLCFSDSVFSLSLLHTHSKRKATAAICLYLGICAKGKSIAPQSGVSNPGLIPTVHRKSTYSNLVLNFAP
jgi:hypothetical protein